MTLRRGEEEPRGADINTGDPEPVAISLLWVEGEGFAAGLGDVLGWQSSKCKAGRRGWEGVGFRVEGLCK